MQPNTPVSPVPTGKHRDVNTMFDSIEIAPRQNNFGTVTKMNRPTVMDLSMGNIQKAFEQSSPKSKDTEDLITPEDKELFDNDQEIDNSRKNANKNKQVKERKKFGTLDGVLARCLLCIWGVIMYLRTGWIVGNSGVWQSILIMLLASSVTCLTSLSLSAICTNGEVKAGGYYFLISRSLGPEFGGVIGILFAFANCISVAMYLTGFAETIVSLYDDSLFNGWDIQIWGEITLVLLVLISMRGVSGVIKFDMVLIVVLIVSIIVYFVGTFTTENAEESLGFTGYSADTFSENWNADYMPGEDFVSVFSVFFPAVTGEMAGANISGDLKNPSRSIPVGTLSAIIISTVVYIIIALSLGATVLRKVGDSKTKGLYYDYMIMAKISAFSPLVIVGIFASTLSSGMSCFIGAPRIFQAVCQDNVFPQLHYFAKGRESDGEPVRAYGVAFVICFLSILTGNINFIAPIITNFFLITYALMNYSCFAWSLTHSPGWRPTFKYYNKWVSLFASAECIALMFLIDYIMALVTVVIGLLMYKYVSHTEPSVHWGTASEALQYMQTIKTLLKYQRNLAHAKNERPTFLIFNRSEEHIKNMWQMAEIMNTECHGLTMIGDVIIGHHDDIVTTNRYIKRAKQHKWNDIPENIIKNSLIQTCIAETYIEGTRIILQTAGIGAIRPNVILLNQDDYNDRRQSLKSIDVEKNMNKLQSPPSKASVQSSKSSELTAANYLNVKKGEETMDDDDDDDMEEQKHQNMHAWDDAPDWIGAVRNALFTGCGVVMVASEIDWVKPRTGFIDIWWLYDDGGLTVLIPFLLKSHESWQECTLRIMALENLGMQDQIELANLMKRLRIKAEICPIREGNTSFDEIPINKNNKSDSKRENSKSRSRSRSRSKDKETEKEIKDMDYIKTPRDDKKADIPLVTDIDMDIYEGTLFSGSKLMKSSFIDNRQKSLKHEVFEYDANDMALGDVKLSVVSDNEMGDMDDIEIVKKDTRISAYATKKLTKYKKLGTLIVQSKSSDLCVVTMPFPRAEYSPYEYMKIIESLTPPDMTNLLFVRGNQDQVLTFAL